MTEDRSIPRYPDKSSCVKCDDKGYVVEERKNGDRVTTPCSVCVPSKSSLK